MTTILISNIELDDVEAGSIDVVEVDPIDDEVMPVTDLADDLVDDDDEMDVGIADGESLAYSEGSSSRGTACS